MADNVFENWIVHSDIAEVLPYLPDMHNGDMSSALEKLKDLVEADNKYASYVLGCLFLFGKTPRFYLFNKSYEEGEVRRKAMLEIQEQKGFGYWIQLLKLKGTEIEDFHLEGLYDLYKVMQGSEVFFEKNDISCRPDNESHPMFNLFRNEQKLRDFLYRQNHHEVYLDVARDSLKMFEENQSQEDMALAVDCLNRILDGDPFNRHSQHEVAQANFEVGKLFLHGNPFFERDMRKAIAHLTESRLDVAYCELLAYYQKYGDKYISSIRKCIGMIRDDELRLIKYQENNIQPPPPVDLSDSLAKLAGLKRKTVEMDDYVFDQTAVIKIPKIIDENLTAQRDAEIAQSFELLKDDIDQIPLLDKDQGDDDGMLIDGMDVSADFIDEYNDDDEIMDFEIIE